MGRNARRTDNENGGTGGKRLCDGVHVNGTVAGTDILFTVDTGATRTVLSSMVYERLEEGNRPKFLEVRMSSCGEWFANKRDGKGRVS